MRRERARKAGEAWFKALEADEPFILNHEDFGEFSVEMTYLFPGMNDCCVGDRQ